jgi:hypothetical protein
MTCMEDKWWYSLDKGSEILKWCLIVYSVTIAIAIRIASAVICAQLCVNVNMMNRTLMQEIIPACSQMLLRNRGERLLKASVLFYR